VSWPAGQLRAPPHAPPPPSRSAGQAAAAKVREECVVCLVNQRDHILIPCGHFGPRPRHRPQPRRVPTRADALMLACRARSHHTLCSCPLGVAAAARAVLCGECAFGDMGLRENGSDKTPCPICKAKINKVQQVYSS
jgi:hypothetical protein